MDTLRPGHAHRSSSYRLLNNYLDTQKTILHTLLTLLSHSHSSTSSLLAYSTSSPGIQPSIRRSVRHAAFEGPLSPLLLSNAETGSIVGSDIIDGLELDAKGWAAYVGSLERFRKELKVVFKLEEDITRVKRDREILVSRLIKTTKKRPTKSDLSEIAASYRPGTNMSSRASMSSVTSGGSNVSKEGKRATKLADAQAELLGCEEHLASLEVAIERERNKVLLHGLEERFRAMEAVGRMWIVQARKGLGDLGKYSELPADAFEVDSNPSLSPSQSASQFGIDGGPRLGVPFPRMPVPGGSIGGSIAEEEEGASSGDEAGDRQLVVHENGPRSITPTPARAKSPQSLGGRAKSPLGVPSITQAYSTDFAPGDGYDSDGPPTGGGLGGGPRRRAASDIGVRPYRSPKRSNFLRRTNSDQKQSQQVTQPQRAGSDTTSVRSESVAGGQRKKKKGFFNSLADFFRGPPRPLFSGRDSPPYGSGQRGNREWQTRTDNNVKRSSTFGGAPRPRRRVSARGDDSSSDDEPGQGLISVSNNNIGGANTWSAGGNRDLNKRSSALPVASGLIPPDPRASGRTTPLSTRSITPKPLATARPTSSAAVSRSGTVKSANSNGTAKSGGTTKKRTRPNGSISRTMSAGSATQSRNIMSLVDPKTPTGSPSMPDVPKAPKSQTDPLAGSLPKAPGSSIVAATNTPPKMVVPGTEPRPRPASRGSMTKKVPKAEDNDETSPPRKTPTPLPPSRTLSPPLKSALRPSSPAAPRTMPALAPPIDPKPLYTISAPGPVNLPKEEPATFTMPSAPVKASPAKTTVPATADGVNTAKTPVDVKRQSTASTMTGQSVYESADEGNAPGVADDSESEAEDEDNSRYKVVDNERIKRLGINVGPPEVEKMPEDVALQHAREDYDSAVTDDSDETAGPRPARDLAAQGGGDSVRRKSVRMNVPESTSTVNAVVAQPQTAADGAAMAEGENPMHEQWKTRIGQMREDTTDESEGDDDYREGRKGLMKNTGQWELVDGKQQKTKTSAIAKGRGLFKSR